MKNQLSEKFINESKLREQLVAMPSLAGVKYWEAIIDDVVDIFKQTLESKIVKDNLNKAISEAKKARDNELLAQWQEEKPIESLEAAVTDSARFGGINSYELGYDQGYLDCANQVIKLLSQSTK